ncbi:hypothetical protein M569_02694 [Genlisea aurea]|uniref:Cytochrome P450 n=1 Tax=Genlisea aurea TaxID=192259 RepID=S8CXB3_9LAMI|nr:hypothetical protein M569_02694 [Genlisea aurea]
MLLHFGTVPVLVASSVDAAREIMKNQDVNFLNRAPMELADKLMYGRRDLGFAPYGEYWRQMRSVFTVHLVGNRKVQSFAKIREEEASNLVEKIRGFLNRKEEMNLSDMIVGFTNDVISRVALGRKYGNDDEMNFRKLLVELPQIVSVMNIRDYIPRLGWINKINGFDRRVDKLARGLDGYLSDILHERRERNKHGIHENGGEEASNLIDILLELQRENIENIRIDDESIKAIILDMFTAGTDTTSALIGWTMAELMKNPRTMRILQNEVRNNIKSSEDNQVKIPYLEAVFKETLRLHPPLPLLLPRESIRDTKLMGYDIKACTPVLINVWALGTEPSIWENPQEFYPERFLTESGKNIDFRGLNFELIPFGAGRRGCPGINFGMAVAELVVAELVSHFDFSLPNGETENDMDMSEKSGLSAPKKLPLIVIPK